MARSKINSDWPSRVIQLRIARFDLALRVPDNPYAMLDLPSVEQAFEADEYMPYWAHLWPASLMLADWLVRQANPPADPAPARPAQTSPPPPADASPPAALPPPPAETLEIGCGLGVAGLAAARIGYRVTMTDYDPDAVDYAAANARLNHLDAKATLLDWRNPPVARYRLVLAADVLYEQRNHGPILEFLRLSLPAGGVAVLSDPCRRTADRFLRDAPTAGWRIHVEPTRREDVDGRIIVLRPR